MTSNEMALLLGDLLTDVFRTHSITSPDPFYTVRKVVQPEEGPIYIFATNQPGMDLLDEAAKQAGGISILEADE
ncbi:MAG TPA: hypothetical protein VFV58_39310 [Blastocatellia bacterium]|jgi:hypothetical protein|nr:hypothetical protein [Blastocatellia bacterium]